MLYIAKQCTILTLRNLVTRENDPNWGNKENQRHGCLGLLWNQWNKILCDLREFTWNVIPLLVVFHGWSTETFCNFSGVFHLTFFHSATHFESQPNLCSLTHSHEPLCCVKLFLYGSSQDAVGIRCKCPCLFPVSLHNNYFTMLYIVTKDSTVLFQGPLTIQLSRQPLGSSGNEELILTGRDLWQTQTQGGRAICCSHWGVWEEERKKSIERQHTLPTRTHCSASSNILLLDADNITNKPRRCFCFVLFCCRCCFLSGCQNSSIIGCY